MILKPQSQEAVLIGFEFDYVSEDKYLNQRLFQIEMKRFVHFTISVLVLQLEKCQWS